jgi:hypothetical protein
VQDVAAAEEYATVCEGNCHEPGDMYRCASAVAYTLLSTREARKMPEEHIETVLRCLNNRTVLSRGGVPIKVVAIEEVPHSGMQKKHRLVVAKAALDEMADGRMSVRAVLEAMAHRYTHPTNYLANRPFRASDGGSGNDAYMPQLADCFSIGLHSPKCAIKDVNAARAAVVQARAAGVEWPWADNRCLRVSGVDCTCFRRKPVFASQGVSMADGTRSTLQASMGQQDLAEVGMATVSRTELDCPFDELGWRAHVKRLTGKDLNDLDEDERVELAPAHPRSRAWVAEQPTGDCYPFSEALSTLKQRREAFAPLGSPAEADRWKHDAERMVEALRDPRR